MHFIWYDLFVVFYFAQHMPYFWCVVWSVNATFIKEKSASYQISCLQHAQILLLVILLKSFLIIRISLIGNKKGVSKHVSSSMIVCHC